VLVLQQSLDAAVFDVLSLAKCPSLAHFGSLLRWVSSCRVTSSQDDEALGGCGPPLFKPAADVAEQ